MSLVQFIGGEPTLHPGLPRLVDHALNLGLKVEVYTNLVRVSEELWRVFRRDGVRLATSYYSTVAAEHDAFTGRRSHARTLANIVRGVDELCGACAVGKLAISATGAVWPCVFSRWFPVGDIRGNSLAAINRAADAVRGELATAFAQRRPVQEPKCPPDKDGHPCNPPCRPHYQCPPFKPL